MSMQNRRILSEMKVEMRKLYKDLSEQTRKRDEVGIKKSKRKIQDMEKCFVERLCRVYECNCDSDEDSDEAYEQYLLGKPPGCLGCLRDFVDREGENYPPLLDRLNWGLTGTLEVSNSDDDSSGVTSTDEDLPKSSSFAKHKALRKLRREGPDKFQLRCHSVSVSTGEVSNTDLNEEELMSTLMTKSFQDLFTTQEHVASGAEYFDDYSGGLYKLSSDTTLKQKFSNSRFDFISTVVDELQEYLKRHPIKCYPNISELIASSNIPLSSDKEALNHYYDVLQKGIGRNVCSGNPNEPEKSHTEVIQKKTFNRSTHKNNYQTGTLDLLTEDVANAQNTGKLDLSNQYLIEVPGQVWILNKLLVEAKENDASLNQKKTCEPLKCLDLHGNVLNYISPEGNCFDTLTVLNLANNNISRLPTTFKNFKCLVELNIANNKMNKLPKQFTKIITLKKLNMSNNKVERVPDNLGNLKNLVILDLRWNKLKTLPESMGKLRSLKVLNAGYNRLRSLSSKTNNMDSLVVLDISYNKLSALPTLTGLSQMIVFNASGNYIKHFPVLSGCKRLCEVRLDGNRIKTLNINHMKNVPAVQLTLSYNKLLEIPEDFYQLDTIVLLDLTGNRLTWLPWSLARLKYLSCIKVELNEIKNVRTEDIKEGSKRIMEVLLRNLLYYQGEEKSISKDIRQPEATYFNIKCDDESSQKVPVQTESAELNPPSDEGSYSNLNLLGKQAVPLPWMHQFVRRKVSTLDLSRNKLGWFPHTLTMLSESLEQLYVRSNCFKLLPDFISELKCLTVLDISENHLTTLPAALAKCPLVKLYCKCNEFSSIPNILFTMPTLSHLDLSLNNIKVINVQGLKNLKKLEVLNLNGNEITHVPSSLGFLSHIKELGIMDNLFKYPDKTVVDKGTNEILSYLRKHDDRGVLYKYSEGYREQKPRGSNKDKKLVNLSNIPVKSKKTCSKISN